MMLRNSAAAILFATVQALAACAGPDANLRSAIDIRLYDSDEQLLIIRNATAEPLEILQGRNGSAKTLAPDGTVEIRFRVVSLESHLRVADQSYYFRTAGPVTNRFEELDGQKFVDATPASSVVYYRDRFGRGEFAIDLESCADTPPGNRWETKQWGTAAHHLDLPLRMDGASQPVCPGR